MIRYISTRVGVMYLGRMVELAPTDEIFREPLHPYTKALISALPVPDPEAQRNPIILSGDVPSPQNPPPGCTFHTRCTVATDICRSLAPEWREIGPGRFVACHIVEK